MTAEEKRSCGIPVPGPKPAQVKPPGPPPATDEQFKESIAENDKGIKKLIGMEHEAALRAQHHPNEAAKVYYVTLEVDMKDKIKKMRQDKATLMGQEKAFKKNNPDQIAPGNNTKNTTTASDGTPYEDICKDAKTKLRCCEDKTCNEELMQQYDTVQKQKAEAYQKSREAEDKAREGASAAGIEKHMATVKSERLKISELNTKLTGLIARLNDAAGANSTTIIPEDQEPLPPAPAPEGQGSTGDDDPVSAGDSATGAGDTPVPAPNGLALAAGPQGGDTDTSALNGQGVDPNGNPNPTNTASPQNTATVSNDQTPGNTVLAAAMADFVALIDEDEEEDDEGPLVSTKKAKQIMDDAREKAVKDKCIDMQADEAKAKEQKQKKLAEELGKKTLAAFDDKETRKEKVLEALKEEKAIKAQPIVSNSAVALREDAVARAKKLAADAEKQWEDLKKDEKMAKKKAMTVEEKKKEKTEKAAEYDVKEGNSKENAKKQEKPVKEAMKQREKKAKDLEKATKISNIEKLAQLPANCRPEKKARFLAQTKDGETVWLDIGADGAIESVGASYRYMSLDGIMFHAVNGVSEEEEEDESSMVYLGEVKDETLEKAGISPPHKVQELKELEEPQQPKQSMLGEDNNKAATNWNDYQIVHVFNANKQSSLLGASNDAQQLGNPEENAAENEAAPLAWDEKGTKKEFEKIQEKYNDPEVWTMCANEDKVCRSGKQYKMKFGAGGKFRYRVSDGNVPCNKDVFGADFSVSGNPKLKCYKYTPNARRRRNTGMFKDVVPNGIKAEFYNGIGDQSNLAAARTKAKSMNPGKQFFITGGGINYPLSTGTWDQLDDRFLNHFYAKFTGVLMIAKTATYTFYLTAADGAALRLDDVLVACEGSCREDEQKKDCSTLCKESRQEKDEDGKMQTVCMVGETPEVMQACYDAKMATRKYRIQGPSTPKFELEYYKNSSPEKILKLEWAAPGGGKEVLTDKYIGQYEKFVEEGGDWEDVGKDGDEFTITEKTEVRYGKAGKWVYKFFDKDQNKVMCGAATFGDPVADATKRCYKRMDTKNEKWMPCAADKQICKGFPGSHKVRYGADGKFNFMETAGDTPCNAEEFGDPIPGAPKECWVLFVPAEEEKKEEKKVQLPPPPYNLALNATTSQKSVAPFPGVKANAAFDGESKRAVDGNTDGNYGAGSCTHTYPTENPWWKVELPKESKVYSVKIYARTDPVENCKHPDAATGSCALTRVQVFVGDSPVLYLNKPCEDEKDIDMNVGMGTINCQSATGKYVFVQRTGIEASMSLCEVQVIGLPVSEAEAEAKAKEAKVTLYSLELRDGWEANGKMPQASVERECASCQSNLCVFSGLIQQTGGAEPDPTTTIGILPEMCVPKKKHTFQVPNADTGSAEVTVHPDGKMTVSKITTKIEWDRDLISLHGIYYLTQPQEKDTFGTEEDTAVFKGFDGFSWKKFGPYCMLWGRVGGKAGSTLGTTPGVCRPSQKHIFHVASNNVKAWVSVDTSGVVRLETTGPIAPKYPEPKGWRETGGHTPGLNATAWINPLKAVGSYSNENITCDEKGCRANDPMKSREEFEAENKAKGLNPDGSVPDELPLDKEMFPGGNLTVNRSGAFNIKDLENPVTPATTGPEISKQELEAERTRVEQMPAGPAKDAAVAAFSTKEKAFEAQEASPMARAAIAAKKAHAAATEMLKVANTSHNAPVAAEKAQRLAKEAAHAAASVYNNATDARQKGGNLDVSHNIVDNSPVAGPNSNNQATQPSFADEVRLIELGEDAATLEVTDEGIWVSLAGIVWSTDEHHPYEYIKRPNALTPAEKAALVAQKTFVFPSPDQCAQPKVDSENVKHMYETKESYLQELQSQIVEVDQTAETAVTEAQKASFEAKKSTLQNKTKTVNQKMTDLNAKEMRIKSQHAPCFLPSLSMQLANQLNISTANVTEDPAKYMCGPAYNGTLPACCSSDAYCSDVQLKGLQTALTSTLSTLEGDATTFETNIAAGTNAAANQGLLTNVRKDIQENSVKKSLVDSAERSVKQSRRTRAESQADEGLTQLDMLH